jgi:tRNA/rRNA methyltransferase
MVNMGLSRLVLVRPPDDVSHDAVKLAAGADSILEQATVFSSLKEAVAEHGLVFATSRHTGRLRKNVQTPRDAAREILPLLQNNNVAIVFGNEVNGLTREDLALCNEIITIPSSNTFASLNLSHAVMIVLYELFLASKAPVNPVEQELASAKMLEDFYRHLQKTLVDIEFLDRCEPERMMMSLRQIFGRSRLCERDVAILRGILSTVDRIQKGEK